MILDTVKYTLIIFHTDVKAPQRLTSEDIEYRFGGCRGLIRGSNKAQVIIIEEK